MSNDGHGVRVITHDWFELVNYCIQTDIRWGLVSWHKRTWGHFLARCEICTNKYISLQFPKEMNTRGSKTPTSFIPFHTYLQSFD